MPRTPRIHFPGAIFHATLRGNDRERIFFERKDYLFFYVLLREGTERFGHRIHAFCLMPNHVHLLIEVALVSLGRVIQNVSFRYAQWVNQRYRRVGHRFQGRYHASLVDREDYLLETVRHVHLNPVRANLAAHPGEFPWSSHRGYIGREVVPWLTTAFVLGRFNASDPVGDFDEFVRAGIGTGIPAFMESSSEDSPVGTSPAATNIDLGAVSAPSLDSITRIVCVEYKLRPEDLRGANRSAMLVKARDVLVWTAIHTGAATVTDLARYLYRTSSAISASLARSRAQIAAETPLREVTKRVRLELLSYRGSDPD